MILESFTKYCLGDLLQEFILESGLNCPQVSASAVLTDLGQKEKNPTFRCTSEHVRPQAVGPGNAEATHRVPGGEGFLTAVRQW